MVEPRSFVRPLIPNVGTEPVRGASDEYFNGARAGSSTDFPSGTQAINDAIDAFDSTFNRGRNAEQPPPPPSLPQRQEGHPSTERAARTSEASRAPLRRSADQLRRSAESLQQEAPFDSEYYDAVHNVIEGKGNDHLIGPKPGMHCHRRRLRG